MKSAAFCRRITGSNGFVLVGVVMMVLALTILGLSLFSLSSYEAQFMNRSLDSDQALQCALGGLDRARFVLATPPNTLERVKLGLRDSVIWARASQHRLGITPDSSGIMVENGNDVLIEVAARYRGVTRFASSYYHYAPEVNYYERLMSVGAGGIVQYTNVGVNGSCGTLKLGDSLWVYGPIVTTDEVNPPTTWPDCLLNLPNFGVNPRFVPTPQVASFLAFRVGAPIQGDVLTYSLPGAPGTVRYFTTDEPFLPGDDDKFSCHAQGDATVTVNGWAVWMFPHGFRVDGLLQIKAGSPNACLAIVAGQGSIKQGGVTYRAGIWCFGGLRSEIPLILVSDDAVEIEQRQHPRDFSLAMQLSVFANRVVLTGPESGYLSYLTLSYDSFTMDPLIDQLMSVGALPNSISSNPLSFQPGTWRSSP